jgi:hypothetical protein
MLKVKRLSYGFAILMYLMSLNNFVSAAGPINNEGLQSMQGTINHIDSSHNKLVVDDMSYAIGADVTVVTPTGHTGRLALLYPGKRVRMLIQFNDSGNIVGTIHKIYMLR